jgi:hypothetical protein
MCYLLVQRPWWRLLLLLLLLMGGTGLLHFAQLLFDGTHKGEKDVKHSADIHRARGGGFEIRLCGGTGDSRITTNDTRAAPRHGRDETAHELRSQYVRRARDGFREAASADRHRAYYKRLRCREVRNGFVWHRRRC